MSVYTIHNLHECDDLRPKNNNTVIKNIGCHFLKQQTIDITITRNRMCPAQIFKQVGDLKSAPHPVSDTFCVLNYFATSLTYLASFFARLSCPKNL